MEQYVAQQILKVRDALVERNLDEAYHQLYTLADPEYKLRVNPWEDVERAASQPSPAKAEQPFNRDENSVEGKAAIEFYEWLQRSSMAKAEVPINIKWRMFVDQKNVKQKNNQ